MPIEKTITGEDELFIYGFDTRRNDRTLEVENVTDWSRWKGRSVADGNLDDDQKRYAQGLATLLNNDGNALASEFEVSFHELIPVEILAFVANIMLVDGSIEKKHFKDVLRRWLFGETLLAITSDQKYVKADTSVVDVAIDEVHSENGDKFDGTDKMVNWLVGQVMKKTQGKADAAYVKDRIRELCQKHTGANS